MMLISNLQYKLGNLHNKLWTAVYIMRCDIERIISVKRTGDMEEQLYDKEKNS